MSILDLIRAPAKTIDALRNKLAQLQDANPLAAKPDLMRRRDEALMAGDDKTAAKLEAEITQCDRDDRRRELAIETTMRELEQAQQAEHQAEIKRKRKAGEAATKRMPETLAELERAFDSVNALLDRIGDITAAVDECNAVLPPDQQLPNPEWLYRGGQPADKRVEVTRKVLGTQWFYRDSGAPVGGQQVAMQDGSSQTFGDVTKIKSDDGIHGTLTVIDREVGSQRIVHVIKKRVTRVTYDDARPAFDFPSLQSTTVLPAIVVAESSRPARQQHSEILIENNSERAKADSEAAA